MTLIETSACHWFFIAFFSMAEITLTAVKMETS
jgi:hypothetical protein